jgi:uracil-DNA glycosylase
MTNMICPIILKLSLNILIKLMIKKISPNTIKLIKYYKFINYNLIYNNKAINRYKKDNFELSADKIKDLERLKKSILNIKNCSLKNEATNMVFSDGNPKSKIMILGEAPGSNEDLEGLPFVGKAGALLDKMLASINLDRKNVYISNIINYRPPENRRPTDDEMNRYLPFIKKHIEIIAPNILVLLGSTAMNALMGSDLVISKVRGKWIERKFGQCKTSIIVTFHPAFLMRQPTQKKLAWNDLKMIREKKTKFKI